MEGRMRSKEGPRGRERGQRGRKELVGRKEMEICKVDGRSENRVSCCWKSNSFLLLDLVHFTPVIRVAE